MKNRCVFRVDLGFDSGGSFLEIAQDFIDSFVEPSQFSGQFAEFDAVTLDVALEKVAIDESRSSRQAGRYARAPKPEPPPPCLIGPEAVARTPKALPGIGRHRG